MSNTAVMNENVRHKMVGCINISPVFPGKEKEVAADIIDLYKSGAIARVAFSMYLEPYGVPEPVDVATPFAEEFLKLKTLLADCGIPAGILLNSLMGHVPFRKHAPYQKVKKANGTLLETFCPADPGFLEYIGKTIRTLAATKPAFYIFDDDNRLRPHGFCFCEHHIQLFNKKTGYDVTDPAQIADRLKTDPEFYNAWAECQTDSLAMLAQTVRDAIDSFDPYANVIVCGGCSVRDELLRKAAVLTGKGHTPMIRMGNSVYLNDGCRGTPGLMMRMAYQRKVAFPADHRVITEMDSFTRELYATSAQKLHMQYIWALLIGCCGAKLWITELNDYDAESGFVYRKKLKKYAGFYRVVGEMIPEWKGVFVPFPAKPQDFDWVRWADPVFSTWGIPFSFERYHKTERLIALSKGYFESYTPEELKSILSGRVLLDGASAMELTNRGYGDLIGCTAKPWDLYLAAFEEGLQDDPVYRVPESVMLEDLRPGAEVRTRIHVKDADSGKVSRILPGTVKFKNALGGEVYTVAGIASQMDMQTNQTGAFEFMNRIRRRFLSKELGFGMHYAGEAPVFFGLFTDRGSEYGVAINIGLDTLEDFALTNVPDDLAKVETLQPDGSWKEAVFKDHTIDVQLSALDVAVFRFTYK